jgi:hypothetical protein
MGITVDVSKLNLFQEKLKQLNTVQKNQFFQQTTAEIANMLLSLVIPRTPVGSYAKGAGKVGGTLRRGWMVKGKSTVPAASVERIAGGYAVTLTNSTYYASYVEEGHRQTIGRYVPAIGKRLVKGWVEGQHFLKISELELQSVAPGIIQARLDAFLRGVF